MAVWYFDFETEFDDDPSMDGYSTVWVVSDTFWLEHGHYSDSVPEPFEEFKLLADQAGMIEVQESVYQVTGTKDEVRELLTAIGFKEGEPE